MRSTDIAIALINKALADPVLMGLTPDGVFKDIAGPSMVHGRDATRFVIVSFVIGSNTRVFNRRGFQEGLYLIEARMLSSAGGDVNAAAARLDELFDPQPPAPPATLTIPGFGLMACYQDEPTELVEFEVADASMRWDRAGGRYSIWTQPRAT